MAKIQKNGKILICEDLLNERNILKGILEKANYNIILEAESGLEALKSCEKDAPDMVLLDLEMPQMDGLETLIRIKEIDKNIRVIMLSNLSQQEQVIDALQAGALDFIMKPFQEEHVLETIEKNRGIKGNGKGSLGTE